MAKQIVYLVWLQGKHTSHEEGIVTADQKQSFIEAEALKSHVLPDPIHTYGVLNYNESYGHVRSQSGKTITRYWFEPITINAHLEVNKDVRELD